MMKVVVTQIFLSLEKMMRDLCKDLLPVAAYIHMMPRHDSFSLKEFGETSIKIDILFVVVTKRATE